MYQGPRSSEFIALVGTGYFREKFKLKSPTWDIDHIYVQGLFWVCGGTNEWGQSMGYYWRGGLQKLIQDFGSDDPAAILAS